MKQLIILFWLFGLFVLNAQKIRVLDIDSHLPVGSVVVLNNGVKQKTNNLGEFFLKDNTRETIYKFSSIGYITSVFSGAQILEQSNVVYLKPLEDLNEVIVSNTKWKQKSRNVSKQFVKISKEKIEQVNAQTAADLLQKSGQVFVQKSQLGGGSPMIRGFSANRLLISIDGVRMNNAIFRSGNLQNIISIDPFVLESAEVILGPGSVVYGSDAIGGTMNFMTKTPNFSSNGTPNVKGTGIYRFSSANLEQTLHGDVSLGFKKWAFLSSFSFSDFDNLRQGSKGSKDYLRNSYVKTIDNLDEVVLNNNPREQISTGFNQSSFVHKIRFQPSKKWDVDLDFVYNKTSDYDRYDRLLRTDDEGLFNSAEWFYGPQEWLKASNSIKLEQNTSVFDNIQIINTYQFFEESRNTRDFGSLIRSTNKEKLHGYNLNLDAEKNKSKYIIYYGLEYVYNKVYSTAFNLNIETKENTSLITRYPNGANWNSLGSYFVINWNVSNKIALSGGLRYSHVLLDVQFSESELNFPFTEAKVNTGAFTGSAGATYKFANAFLLKADLGTAFRAPNIDDIGKITQDSEPGTLVVPNPKLKSEYAYNGELSLLYKNKGYTFSVASYYSYLDNAMSTDDFTLNGESSVFFEGEESVILARQNSSNLYVYGLELMAEIPLTKNLKTTAAFTITKGEETQSDKERVPVRHVSPNFGNGHLIYSRKNWELDFYFDFNEGFSYNQLPPSEQSKSYIYAINSEGNPYLPSWYTLNIRSQINLNENIKLNLSLENVTNQRYRTYSSGVSSPGINFIGSLQYVF